MVRTFIAAGGSDRTTEHSVVDEGPGGAPRRRRQDERFVRTRQEPELLHGVLLLA